MDQEDKDLAEVLGEFEIKLREFRVGVEEREALNRTTSFACRYGCREFSAFLVVNGLDRDYSKHAIEDRFSEAAGHVLGDPKVEEAPSAWRLEHIKEIPSQSPRGTLQERRPS